MNYQIREYHLRDAEYYMKGISDNILDKLNDDEKGELKSVIYSAIPHSSPKLIDLRFTVNLLFRRYFFVLLVGKDHHRKSLRPRTEHIKHSNLFVRIVDKTMAVLLIATISVLANLFVLSIVYVVASTLGIKLLSRWIF
ncbi:hypothetical protein HCU40_03680 [Pseudanabaena biceps]|nr:hypothetical protein [Pseudanabaena biceps]